MMDRLFYVLIGATIVVAMTSITLSITALGIVNGWWRPEWAQWLVGQA